MGELVTKLDTLAKSENQSAAILLCKIALARNNQQMVDSNWAHIKEDRAKKATVIFNKPELSDLKGVISTMDSKEKKEFIIELISEQAGGTLTLAKLVEFTEEGMRGSNPTLEELPNNALRSLAKSRASRRGLQRFSRRLRKKKHYQHSLLQHFMLLLLQKKYFPL